MYKIITIDNIDELKYLVESNGVFAQLILENGDKKIFQRIDNEWVEVNIYNG